MKPCQIFGVYILLLPFIILVGCESDSENPVSSTEKQQPVEFSFAGGINSDFSKIIPEFKGKARLEDFDSVGFITLNLSVKGSNETITERASIFFRLKLETDNIVLTPGKYWLSDYEISRHLGSVNYYLENNSESYSLIYEFSLTSASLSIDEVSENNILGTCSIGLQQTFGEHRVKGLITKEELARPTSIKVSFNMELLHYP